MTQDDDDAEIKEQQAPAAPSSPLLTTASHNLNHHKERVAARIEMAAETGKLHLILKALIITIALRRRLRAPLISPFLNFALTPGSEAHSRLASYFPKDDEHDMEVDTASSATVTHSPEIEIYCYLMVLISLIDKKRYNEAKACSLASIANMRNLNRRSLNWRTVDFLASRLYFYCSLSCELANSLSEIRGDLLAMHRVATLHHDEFGQERLLNLVLRNYLHYNMYGQAEKFRSKAPRSKAHSNKQFCRYLFYLGKIKTIQLEYTDAKESLLQAVQIAPMAALGFRVQCNKWAVIVRLLLGEIPQRTVFLQKGMKQALRPYFELTNAVRIGDLDLYKTVAEKFSTTFTSDRTNNLVIRLRLTVIRNRLRNISICYSRISLADVATKLRMDTPNYVADVESIVSKAIRDGIIDATLDHANGWMISKETPDICSTNEPHIAFHSRIAFCLNMHNEVVRALRFPPNYHMEDEVSVPTDDSDEYEEDDDEYWTF